MSETLQAKIDKAKQENELAILEIQNKKLARIKNSYDVVETSNSKKRRSVDPEIDSEDEILDSYKRGTGTAMTRDLQRNYSNFVSFILQIELNVVGNAGKMLLNTDDAQWNEEATGWFNSVWSVECEARLGLHWNKCERLSVSSMVRDGDLLCMFDDFLFDDGKVWFWETDQFVQIDEKDFKTWSEDNGGGFTQTQGVIADKWGRVIAYAVSHKRGEDSLPLADVTIIPKASGRFLSDPWRFNQYRGISKALPIVADMEDTYEMRSKELQSAKVAATMAGVVKKKDGLEDQIIQMGDDPEEIIDSATPPTSQQHAETTYDRLGHLTGGLMEYLDDDDEFEFLKIDRPNVDAATFHDFVVQGGGAALGMAKAYALMEAQNSFTAFRGEMIMTWPMFRMLQKWLERSLCDWVGQKALEWGMKKRVVNRKAPKDWRLRMTWSWPTMPEVDTLKAVNAKEKELANGLLSYADIYGPQWRERLTAIAEQFNFARGLNIPLRVFEKEAAKQAENTEGFGNG